MDDPKQLRQYFRLTYPPLAHAKLWVRDICLPLLEVSEQAGRVAIEEGSALSFLGGLPVKIEFPSGHVFESVGNVIRSGDGYIVLKFVPNVPMGIVMDEQMHIVRKFPRGKDLMQDR